MPSFAWVLKNKRLFISLGIFYLLYSKFFNKNKFISHWHPPRLSKEVLQQLFNSFIQTLKKKGIKICRRTPELIDNISIDKIWENFSPELIKTRSTFKKKLSKN